MADTRIRSTSVSIAAFPPEKFCAYSVGLSSVYVKIMRSDTTIWRNVYLSADFVRKLHHTTLEIALLY